MKLNRTGSNWNRLERNKINENWDIIEGLGDSIGKVVTGLVWKTPVDTVEDLPTSAEVGETRMVREADPDGISYVYRYDGENWEKIQAIDVTLINEVDKRLNLQLADEIKQRQNDINNLEARKANRSEIMTQTQFDSWVATLLDGGPSIFYETLSALEADYPNGLAGVALVRETDPARIYVWNPIDKLWQDYGVYQGIEIKDDSLTTKKYTDKSVTKNKISIPDEGLLPITYKFQHGNMSEEGPLPETNSRAYSELIYVEKGVVFRSNNPNLLELTVYRKVGESNYEHLISDWVAEYEIVENMEVRLVAKYYDDRDVRDLIHVIENNIYSVDGKTALSTDDFNDFFEKSLNDKISIKVELERGFFGPDGVNDPPNSTRLRTNDFITIPANTLIKLKDPEEIDYAITIKGEGSYIDGGWTSRSLYFENSTTIKIGLRYKNNKVISDTSFFERNLLIIGPDNLLKVRDLSDFVNDDSMSIHVSIDGRTLQEALDKNPKKILIERGVYYNQSDISAIIDELTILPYGDRDGLVEFRGSDKLDNSNWIREGSIYRQPYKDNKYFEQVFIDRSKPPESDGSRPSYNATIWEVFDDVKDDVKLKPVLTLTECESEVGTFYYDGEDVYINPFNIDNEFHAVKLSSGLSLSGNKLEMQDVVFKYFMNRPIDVSDIKSVSIQNCEASYSVFRDGFSIDRANGRFLNCRAYKNRNDGFNLHYYGDTEFINCDGSFNYDDGISHHENCTGVITGGRWEGNGKGGIAPAHGAKVSWNNALIKDNRYGAFHQHIDEKVSNVSSNNLYIGNQDAIRNDNAELTSFNDKFIENLNDFTGNAIEKIKVY